MRFNQEPDGVLPRPCKVWQMSTYFPPLNQEEPDKIVQLTK